MKPTSTDIVIATIKVCLRQSQQIAKNFYDNPLEQRSYSEWAMNEIIERLSQNSRTPPLMVIEEFRDQMNDFSCINPITSYIFSCAKDTAEWIIDLLIA